VEPEIAHAVWADLARFASYAFCKAHAAGYGALAYQSTYLKSHFPTEYAVGVLNHHAGMYATWVHVEDLRRNGVTFHAPCAQRSVWDTTYEAGAVRVGLSRVFGLTAQSGERMLAARARQPFASLADFVDRARPSSDELETLALSGALDWTGRTRPSLLLEVRAGARFVAPRPRTEPALVTYEGRDLLPTPMAPVAVPELPEFDLPQRVRGEVQATGLWFSGHPLELFVDSASLARTVPAAEVERHVDRRVAVAGLPCAYRRVETRSGGLMLFMTLADRTGLVECVLFPDAYRAWANAARGEVVRAEGRVDETLGAITVVVDRVEALLPQPRIVERHADVTVPPGPYGRG
jgi:DNA polymerase III alpha subunit